MTTPEQIKRLHKSATSLGEQTFSDQETTIKNTYGATIKVKNYLTKDEVIRSDVEIKFKKIDVVLAQSIIDHIEGYFVNPQRQMELNFSVGLLEEAPKRFQGQVHPLVESVQDTQDIWK